MAKDAVDKVRRMEMRLVPDDAAVMKKQRYVFLKESEKPDCETGAIAGRSHQAQYANRQGLRDALGSAGNLPFQWIDQGKTARRKMGLFDHSCGTDQQVARAYDARWRNDPQSH